MLHHRPLTGDDLPLAMRLKEQAGWNQTEADIRRFLALQPDGCFVVELDDTPVGTVAAFLFEPVAWIAFVLVDAAVRGRGVGQALMRRALDFIDDRGVASVRLDATALGRPLYEKLGFVAEFTLARFEGVPAPSERPTGVVQGRAEHFEAIVALDRRASGADRRDLLSRLIQEQPEQLRVVEQHGQMSGFLLARPGSRAWMIGPCVADDAAGRLLLADAFRRFAGKNVFVDLPLERHFAVELAQTQGLTIQRELLRMRRGPAVSEEPALIWASSGPEKG